MLQDQERQSRLYTLQELHSKRADSKGFNGDAQTYIACANYARSAMLADLNAVLNGKSERLYNKTDDEMLERAKIFYRDYKSALNRALMLR